MHGQFRRVLVAGHLALDAPLRQLPHARDDQHEIIRDATLSAFEFLVEAAIDQSVEALILQGNLLGEGNSLRACSTFRDGIETLLDAGVEVLWVVQKPQEQILLEELNCLPAGLKLLTQQHQHCLLLEAAESSGRGDRSLISCDLIDQQSFPSQEWGWTEEQTLLRIGITGKPIGHLDHGSVLNTERDSYFQVILSGEPTRRHTARHHQTIYHASGCLQSLDATITGGCSATLLKIDPEGDIELIAIGTSQVQWESLELTIEPQETGAEWLERAELEFLELTSRLAESPARLVQLQWQIRGSIDQIQNLSSSELADEFATLFAATSGKVPVNHQVQLIPLFSGQVVHSQEFLDEHLEEQFLQHLGEEIQERSGHEQKSSKELTGILQDSKGRPSLPITNLVTALNPRVINHRSAELGLHALRDQSKAG